jgi:predicted lysophospholipase L1 biosynthesis ABC-type transport system permease subunit
MRPGAEAIVVDEVFARRLFPGESAVGRRVSFMPNDEDQREIVGVVSVSRFDSLRHQPMPMLYQPWQPGQLVGADVHVAVRTTVRPSTLFDAMRHAAAGVDATVPIEQLATQTMLIEGQLRNDRLLSLLANGFGIVALLLSGIGLAGLLIYGVTRRTNEIGVRMALGAAPGQVARVVLSDSLWLVATGILLGLPAAYAVAQLLRGTLFDMNPTDPASALLAVATLSTVAAVAAWLPARRAARIDPIAALRNE